MVYARGGTLPGPPAEGKDALRLLVVRVFCAEQAAVPPPAANAVFSKRPADRINAAIRACRISIRHSSLSLRPVPKACGLFRRLRLDRHLICQAIASHRH